MAFPFNSTGSLSPTFVSARHVCLPVKLPSAFTLFCAISVRTEETFGRLRYSLGGDRPSQTAHLTMSRTMFQCIRLEPQQSKSGIPTAAPRSPKEPLQSVPPILCINCRGSISSYSKALRGLSVQSRVNTHLHVYYNFAGPPVETAPKSLLHSCGSELTRQGISLP